MNNHKSSTLRSFPLMAVALMLATAPLAGAHCEIPCGIYGDQMRFDQLEEHFQTVQKSMNKIQELAGAEDTSANANQLVRWTMNKEDHANEIQHIVYHYFMNQRVAPVSADQGDAYEEYLSEITLLHRLLVQAMKCKQTTDVTHVEKLRSYLKAFEQLYFNGAEQTQE